MTASKSVLVTGAAGFIGSNIARSLSADGFQVTICDWFGEDDRWKNVSDVVIHDIVRPEDLAAWLARPDRSLGAVVHMGAISATTERDVNAIIANNIRLSLDLWDYCRFHGVKFVYASSAATYGSGEGGFVDDDSAAGLARLEPLNPYGWSKHFVDRRIVDDVARGERTPPCWAGLKFFNVYGPREAHKGSMRSVVHQIWPAAARGETVRLFRSDHPKFEDGGQQRDFIYVDDCVEIVRRVLASERAGGIYNAGTGKARSFCDLALAVFAAVGREPNIEYVDMPEALKGRYQYFTQADVTRVTAVGLAPQFRSLEQGVAEYVAWLEARPDR